MGKILKRVLHLYRFMNTNGERRECRIKLQPQNLEGNKTVSRRAREILRTLIKSRLLLSDHPVHPCFYSSIHFYPARAIMFLFVKPVHVHRLSRILALVHPGTVMNRVASSRARARANTRVCKARASARVVYI